MFYTLSEFLDMVKDDIGIGDLPLPVSDDVLVKRLESSALKEFSVRYPYIKQCMINDNELDDDPRYVNMNGRHLVYKIPKWVNMDLDILMVTDLQPASYNNIYDDVYGMAYSPDDVLCTISDTRLMAQTYAAVTKTPTIRFEKPDRLHVFNGYRGHTYEITVGLRHDINLTTIPDTAMTNFRELAVLDLQEFLWNKMKRKEIPTGVGDIQLKIEDWQDAGQKKRDLLKYWDDEGANLDIETPQHYS